MSEATTVATSAEIKNPLNEKQQELAKALVNALEVDSGTGAITCTNDNVIPEFISGKYGVTEEQAVDVITTIADVQVASRVAVAEVSAQAFKDNSSLSSTAGVIPIGAKRCNVTANCFKQTEGVVAGHEYKRAMDTKTTLSLGTSPSASRVQKYISAMYSQAQDL